MQPDETQQDVAPREDIDPAQAPAPNSTTPAPPPAVSTADLAAAAKPGTYRTTADVASRPGDDLDGGDNLFPTDQTGTFRDRWKDIQTGFVDEPQQAVQQADALVAEVIQKLAASFADERSKLEKQWDTGDNVSTEDLRMAVRRYRSFLDKLLSL